MPIMNACVKDDRMVDEHECKTCNMFCRHAGEPTTAERLELAEKRDTQKLQLEDVPTSSLVDEIERRGHGTKHFIPPHSEYALRSHNADGVPAVHDIGEGPVLFLAVID